MRLGLALPHYDSSLAGRPVSWDGLVEVARTAESAGFDSLWVSDHLFLDWGKYGGPDDLMGALECWTIIAALASVTTRVRLGSLTLCNDLRNPVMLAKMIATADLISGGRIDVGIGAGWYEPEYQAAGIEFDPPGTRIRRLEESVQMITRLLEGEDLTFQGEYYQSTRATCRPRPAQVPRPPVWVGGKGDRLLGAAARNADGWNFSWLGDWDLYRQRSAVADRACERSGRDPRGLRRSVGAYVLAGTDDNDAKRRFERLVERSPAGVLRDPSGGGAVSWDEFRRDRIAGSVTEVVDRLAPLSELGVEEVIVSLGALPFQVADRDDVELVGREVAAALR